MKNSIYSEGIANAIKSFLKEDDWRFDFIEELGLFKFGLALEGKIKNITYFVHVDKDSYTIHAVSPIDADGDNKKMMANMAEFVCRVNHSLKNGNFNLDMSDGEISYKIHVYCKGIIPTKDMIEHSILCVAAMFERYSLGIVGIIFVDANAEKAIALCERAERADCEDDASDGGSVPGFIKTDLFGTEGDED